MKKISIFILLIVATVLSVSPIYSIDVDRTGDKFSSIPNYDGYQLEYGELDLISSKTATSNYVTYDSWWNPGEPSTYITKNTRRVRTYEFDNYFDIPIKVIDNLQYAPGVYTRNYEQIESYSTTANISTKNALTTVVSYSYSINASVGASAYGISIGINQGSEIFVSATSYNEMTYSNTTSYTIQEKVNWQEIYVNDTNDYMYFQRGFRQKFQAYLVCIYKYNYDVTEWGTGLFGLDRNYSYEFADYECIKTYIYLKPIEIPYYTVSKYIDNEFGNRVIYGIYNSSIYYF